MRRIGREGIWSVVWSTLAVCAILLGCTGAVAETEDMKALKRKNAELQKRVEKLEATIGKLLKDTPEKNSEKAVNRAVDKALAKLEARNAKAKPPVRSKYPIDLYGFVKLDASYDLSRTSVGNFARWVESETGRGKDDHFNMTARQSRVGLKMNGPDVAGTKTNGLVEIDFYGGGMENKNIPFMRHAYVQVDWPEHDFSLLAGQTWDVIAPLNPSTLNYSVQWWAGNLGYRRPQIRLTKGFKMGDTRLVWQGAVARAIGHQTGFDPGDSGEDAGFPHFQTRVAYSFPLLTKKHTTIGVSGHWGQEEWDLDAFDNARSYDSWSICMDATVPIMDKVAVKGEFWHGENLDAYLGGIAQGVNVALRRRVESTGGWGAVSLGPFDKLTFNIGASVDDPNNYDISRGGRALNRALFSNVLYDLTDAVKLGFELSYWDTPYKDIEDADSWRFQTSLIYKF